MIFIHKAYLLVITTCTWYAYVYLDVGQMCTNTWWIFKVSAAGVWCLKHQIIRKAKGISRNLTGSVIQYNKCTRIAHRAVKIESDKVEGGGGGMRDVSPAHIYIQYKKWTKLEMAQAHETIASYRHTDPFTDVSTHMINNIDGFYGYENTCFRHAHASTVAHPLMACRLRRTGRAEKANGTQRLLMLNALTTLA